MKKIIFVFLIFSLFCLTGCDKNNDKIGDDFIMISISSGKDENICQSLNFSVNSNKIKEKSKNNDEYLAFISNLIENVKEIRNEYLYTVALTYMENPDENYKINKGVVLSNVAYFTESDTVGFMINFTSLESWNYYHKTNAQTGEKKENKNIFLNRVESKSQFIFSTKNDSDLTLGEKYKRIYLSSAKGLSFEDKIDDYSPDFVYSYSSPYKKLKSNANIKFENAQLSYHVWKVEEKFINENNEVLLWYNQINCGMWYLAALIAIVVPTFIILLVYVLKKKIEKK